MAIDRMPRLTFAVALGGLCLALAGCGGLPRAPQHAGDVAAIRQVIDEFQAAIRQKDKPAYMRLFFSSRPEEIGWQAVVDDAALARIRQERPQAIKARRIESNNFVALIDSVVASRVAEEERISEVAVDTDGETASASFHYAYLSDGKVTNWGREHWQLVRTEQGWKIYSVVYTIRDPVP